MPLFVPVLRSAMLFMNIYDTYKTLKPPPPSTRDPTRPSVRASTQRKRDLKGCLAVWIVWCCLTLYERLVEGLVNLFIPFYDELKSIVIIFLILTRARGAEPIFLHVLRPLIRPYDASIDGTLEVLRMTGDFLFALAAFPVQQGIKFLRNRFQWLASYLPGDHSDKVSEAHQAHGNGGRPTGSRQGTADTVRGPRQPARRRVSEDSIPDDFLQSPPTTGLSLPNGIPLSPPHQIWHPPRSAYQDEDAIQRTESNGSTGILGLTHDEKDGEDWRKYPAFPSAYPATPLSAETALPPSFGAAATNLFAPLPDEGLVPPQDFHRSLKPKRKPTNPSYATNLSDQGTQPSGIPRSYGLSGTTSETVVETDDEESISDEMSYEEEDSFNKTLQTPMNARVWISAPRALPLSTLPSQSTTVDSVGTITSLQTPILSESASIRSNSARAFTPTDSDMHSSTDVEMQLEPEDSREMKFKLRQRSSTVTRDKPVIPRRRTLRALSPTVKKRKLARLPLASDDGTAGSSSTAGSEDEEAEASPLDAGTPFAEPDVYVPGDQKQIQPEPKRPRVSAAAPGARKGATFTGTIALRTTKTRVPRPTSPSAPLGAAQATTRVRTRAQRPGATTTRAVPAASSVKSRTGKPVGRLETRSRAEPAKAVGPFGLEGRSATTKNKATAGNSSMKSSGAPGLGQDSQNLAKDR